MSFREAQDKLKIDRSLVSGIPHNDEDMAIAKAIISLGHLLGVTVTAEGVQTQAQREFLLTSGCDEMQGYLFSRPRPVAEIQEMLHQEGRSIRAIH